MSDTRSFPCYVLYPGRNEPVWCDTVEEVITYISAENVGRGLPPARGLRVTFKEFPGDAEHNTDGTA